MFHVQKFKISPHDRFFLHGHRPCVRDKYEVWEDDEYDDDEEEEEQDGGYDDNDDDDDDSL